MAYWEYIRQSKARAFEYLDLGLESQALASLMSDLKANPETENHLGIMLASELVLAGSLNTLEKVKDFIGGLN